MLGLVKYFDDKLISIRRKEGWPGFAIDVQVVNVVRSLGSNADCLEFGETNPSYETYRSNWTLFWKVAESRGVRVEERKQYIRLGRIVQEFAVVQFDIQEAGLEAAAFPF